MSRRTAQLQIRITPKEKATLKRLARRAGTDLSGYVLGRALPSPASVRFDALIAALRHGSDRRYVFADLSDLLADLSATELADAVGDADLRGLPAFECNYVAAMVEHCYMLKGIGAPAWVSDVAPLERPWFATELRSLRVHLLVSAPVAFKKRNLFVDSSVGDRV